MSEFLARIPLPGGWMPEGIERGDGTTVFVGSLSTGGIWRGDLRTGTGEVFVEGTKGTATTGLYYQAEGDRLWSACITPGEVRVYDGSSGTLLETYRLPDDAVPVNDIALTDEAVYVTDTYAPRLLVIPLPGDGSLAPASATTTLPLTGAYEQTEGAEDVNLNGIVAVNGALLVAQTITGKLFRVDPATGDTVEVDLGGATLGKPDGLECDGDTLYSVSNEEDRIKVVALDPSLERATVVDELTDPGLEFPTTAAVSADHLWVVNLRLGTAEPGAETPYWITRLPLRR